MLGSVSPYALLRASMPKQSAGAPTAYDLYSLAQETSNPSKLPGAVMPADVPPGREEQSPRIPSDEMEQMRGLSSSGRPSGPSSAAFMPSRKTHYISDIQNRHKQAVRRTTFGPVKG